MEELYARREMLSELGVQRLLRDETRYRNNSFQNEGKDERNCVMTTEWTFSMKQLICPAVQFHKICASIRPVNIT